MRVTSDFDEQLDKVLAAVDWWDNLGTKKRIQLKTLFNLKKTITGLELVKLYDHINDR